jgi:protein-disulfide isomerase
MYTLRSLSTSSRAETRGRLIRAGLAAAYVCVSGAFAGCSDQKTAVAAPAQAPNASAAEASGEVPSTLATIGTEKITLADVRGRAGEQLDQLDVQYRRTRDKLIGSALDSMVRERLLAAESKKTGKTADELIGAAIGGTATPSDVEIAAWYNENQARMNGRTLEQVRPQIADLLTKQRRTEAATKLEQRLRDEQGVKIAFEPFRLTFANAGAPTLGKMDAPVTLVEFSDFQCPYCQAVAPVLKQVAEKFGDKVYIVYRQYPIPSLHPFAFKAAEASLCANEQGKFWALHDAMFEDQKKLAVSDLKATARRLGLDSKKFDGCLDAGRYVEQVQNDQREGQKIGVNGTPAMFINGTYVEGGSVPFSVLEALINKELSRINSKS